MKKKVMILIPHPDDEIMVGNYLLYNLAKDNEYEITVIVYCNGDMHAYEGEIRLKECIRSLACVGLDESRIIFLGYGDSGVKANMHIYHGNNGQIVPSYCGRTETKALDSHPEWCYQKHGLHRSFTRENFKYDLKECMIDLKPDILLCVNYDSHPDHRALSLMFDECMGEVLKSDISYKPLVLKRYSYNGLWGGIPDYFTTDNKTKIDYSKIIELPEGEIRIRCVPAFRWIFSCPLYQMTRCHKTQEADLYATKIINCDEVVFRKHTENLMIGCELSATSGNPSFVNDFKIQDANDITVLNPESNYCAWIPERTDTDRALTIELPKVSKLNEICFYENNSIFSRIKNIQVAIDGKVILETGELIHSGKKNSFLLSGIAGKCITVKILDSIGEESGLSEIEIFENKIPLENYLPTYLIECSNKEILTVGNITRKIERIIFSVYIALRKIFPNKYFYWQRLGKNAPIGKCIKYWLEVCIINRIKFRMR